MLTRSILDGFRKDSFIPFSKVYKASSGNDEDAMDEDGDHDGRIDPKITQYIANAPLVSLSIGKNGDICAPFLPDLNHFQG